MATTLKLPFARFVAQVDTAPAEPKANYQALAARNALALQACGWREAAKTAKATLVTHNFTITHSGDRYDAYLMTGDYSAASATEVAYAGMAAYRFTLPAAYMSGTQALVSVSLPLTRDRFLLPGVRVVAVLSDSDRPAASWSVVRGEASPAAVEAGYLANPATRITAALDDSGTVAMDLSGADATKRPYLWIYLTVEDYEATWTMYSKTEPRLYAVEGSAMLVGEDAAVTFSADVEPDGGTGVSYGEYDLYSGGFAKWFDLPDDSIGPVYDAGECAVTGDGGGSSRFVAVCGANVPASLPGAPGWALYDVLNGRFISFAGMSITRLDGTSPDFTPVDVTTEVLSFIRRNGGVKGVRVLCTAQESYISVKCLMQTDVYHRLTSNPDDINGGPSVWFRYDPSTGAIAHYITGDTQSIYIPKYSFLFRDPAYVSHRNELDARLASIGVYATGSGAVLGFCHSSTTFDAIYAEGGGIDWVGNITREAAIRDFNGSSEEYADYCIAGTFSRLGGVTCNGLAVMSCRRSANSPTVTAAYPLELVFDTRKNLTFHTSPGSSTLFVSGDFTAVNGVAADGAAVVLPPAAAWLLDPSDANYVEPDWRMVVLPLTCGKIEKPASYEDLSYGITQTGKNWTLEFGDYCRVPCLRRANTR